MIRKIKTLIVSTAALLFMAMPLGVAAPALAVDCGGGTTAATQQDCINHNLDCGSNISLDNSNCKNAETGKTLNEKIATGLNVFSAVVATVAVIMIIYGGFRYVSSGGKEESVKGAKTAIMYALIGLVIVALAQVIVQFVLNKAT